MQKTLSFFLFVFTIHLNFCFAQKRFYEIGLGEAIMGSADNEKYLGLHKTLPKGTKILVKNNANGKTVIVKIIGKLPNTGANDRLVIKISESAYKALNAKGKRFGVELFPAPKEVEKDKEEEKTLTTSSPDTLIHKVSKGETLYQIAQKYKVKVEELAKWNDLSKYTLQIGQELKVVRKD